MQAAVAKQLPRHPTAAKEPQEALQGAFVSFPWGKGTGRQWDCLPLRWLFCQHRRNGLRFEMHKNTFPPRPIGLNAGNGSTPCWWQWGLALAQHSPVIPSNGLPLVLEMPYGTFCNNSVSSMFILPVLRPTGLGPKSIVGFKLPKGTLLCLMPVLRAWGNSTWPVW